MPPNPTDLAALAEGLSLGARTALLTAEPRRRAPDPDSLFVCRSIGCREGELKPFTMVTLAGLMLNSDGLDLRAYLKENPE